MQEQSSSGVDPRSARIVSVVRGFEMTGKVKQAWWWWYSG
eukprot:CAMPEP_0174369204 /NCGR_PEP_ID=MMETSP0811_2-20130205/91665_1 /TAXON_ID=73025 ORGANISM="Eutreptiella gymnastica-like, Strain CCMP1594" /NCGR_SAMPLE_ID=MMETSP0811_2 /ASSEMBLY_ACC=CAM_ASM_000667 /LENGTH=39 /DNA_ID= /DNA_START= /DNA_END= /DNA_ORIENTATION=